MARVTPDPCGMVMCKWTTLGPHNHVTRHVGGKFPFISETVVPSGTRGLRCVKCDKPSERAVCC